MELKVKGERSPTVELWNGARAITIPLGERIETDSLAVSKDGRMLFVGGFQTGVLYDIDDPSSPQQVTSVRTQDVFTAASFAADGDALILSETSRQGSSNNVLVVPIDGRPLERAACTIAAGALDATIATRLLSAQRRDQLTCDAHRAK